MSHFLVTGGCGFIGSHLCEDLIACGHQVRVLDDLSTGARTSLAPGATLLEGSVTEATTVARALEGVDGCFHLAAIASVERATKEWVATHRVNSTGTITIFATLARLGAKLPVIYASSAAVYGDCQALPLAETAPIAPLSAYGADKAATEMHARVATHVHAIPTTGLRFFNVYGPRQDPRSPYSGVVSIFAERLRQGSAVTIFGDGGQTRDFVFVHDVVAAMRQAMALRLPGAPVLNVCSGQATSVYELARCMADLCGVKLRVNFAPARRGEIRHSVGNCTSSFAALDLSRPTELAVGLQNYLNVVPLQKRQSA
jgi:UDP-glucose 4-epimerase